MTLMMAAALGNEGEVGAKESAYHIAVQTSNDKISKKQLRLGKVANINHKPPKNRERSND